MMRGVGDGRRGPTTAAAAALALLAALGGLLGGCTERPAAPVWNNLFDPAGPNGGDPFRVVAIQSGNRVTVSWTKPAVRDLDAFEILRSANNVAYVLAGEVAPTVTAFIDTAPAPNAPNYYKVRARDLYGATSAVSHIAPAYILTPPFVLVGEGGAVTPTRHVVLTLRTTAGDSAQVAATSDFAGALAFPALSGGVEFFAPWDLGPAAANGEEKELFVRITTGGVLSPVARREVVVQFRPDLQLGGSPPTVASRTLTVTIAPPAGVAQMRFALSRAGLAGAPWLPGAAQHMGELLGPEPAPQRLFGQFLGDFGFAWIDSVQAVPDNLATASFELAGGAPTTTQRLVPLVSGAVATQMRFSELPDFTELPWQAYADTSIFLLSEAGGVKIVYGQFRNDWFVSEVVADTIVHVPTR